MLLYLSLGVPVAVKASMPLANKADHATAASTSAAPLPKVWQVKPGDTLSNISARLAHTDDWTVKEKVSRALFNANPGAFIGGDQNHLRVGASLSIPSSIAADFAPSAKPVRVVAAQPVTHVHVGLAASLAASGMTELAATVVAAEQAMAVWMHAPSVTERVTHAELPAVAAAAPALEPAAEVVSTTSNDMVAASAAESAGVDLTAPSVSSIEENPASSVADTADTTDKIADTAIPDNALAGGLLTEVTHAIARLVRRGAHVVSAGWDWVMNPMTIVVLSVIAVFVLAWLTWVLWCKTPATEDELALPAGHTLVREPGIAPPPPRMSMGNGSSLSGARDGEESKPAMQMIHPTAEESAISELFAAAAQPVSDARSASALAAQPAVAAVAVPPAPAGVPEPLASPPDARISAALAALDLSLPDTPHEPIVSTPKSGSAPSEHSKLALAREYVAQSAVARTRAQALINEMLASDDAATREAARALLEVQSSMS